MAVYTTLVKTICEQQYMKDNGISDPSQLPDRATILNAVQGEVIPFKMPEGSQLQKSDIQHAILNHYWMREIGLETVGLWKYCICTRLEEIMPKYVEFLTLKNDIGNLAENINETINHSGSGSKTSNGNTDTNLTQTNTLKDTKSGSFSRNASSSSDTDETSTITRTEKNKFSDTPQNGLSDVENGKYLTEYRDITTADNSTAKAVNSGTQAESGSNSETLDKAGTLGSVGNEKTSGSETSTDTYQDARIGFNGDKVSYIGKFMDEYRNVINMIIAEVAPCFMGILG